MKHAHLVAFAALSLVALAGCDSPGITSKGAKSAASMKSGQATKGGTGLAGDDSSANAAPPVAVLTGGLYVSDAIARACNITATAETTPRFDYDSTALAPEDRDMLAKIARCFTEGALRDKGLALIGRADPRGEPEYNMTLGESRADAVQRYIVDLGVGRERVRATSRGEMDATGTDEAGWAHDRRVDLEIAN